MLTKLGLASICLGFLALVIFKFMGSSIDESGVLHEPFALLPIGFGLAFLGLLALGVAALKVAIRKRNARGGAA